MKSHEQTERHEEPSERQEEHLGEVNENADFADGEEQQLEEEELEEEEEEDDSDLSLLVAMAELDAEAAEAYRIAAEYTDQVHLQAKLEEFRADHLRHVEDFNQLLSDAGVPEVSVELDEDSSAMTMLAASMSTMGARSAVRAMIANEHLTTASYAAATELPFEQDVARILEEHLKDERRHLAWLSEQESRVANDELDGDRDA